MTRRGAPCLPYRRLPNRQQGTNIGSECTQWFPRDYERIEALPNPHCGITQITIGRYKGTVHNFTRNNGDHTGRTRSFCVGIHIYISPSCKSPLPGTVKSLNNSSTDSTMVCRLFLRPVGVDGAHRLGGVRASLGLLALLVGLVNGDRVPGRSVGHALLLGGDLALLGGVGLGEARLGGRALFS